jgi:protease II
VLSFSFSLNLAVFKLCIFFSLADYGNPDNAEDFAYILPYSPLHNVRAPGGGEGQYPAVLLATGDHDDRWVELWLPGVCPVW